VYRAEKVRGINKLWAIEGVNEQYDIEEEQISLLLDQNKPDEAFEYINVMLKKDEQNDINLKLLSVSYLTYISSDFFLTSKNYQGFIKSSGKAEKLIKQLKSLKIEEINEMLLNFEASLHQSKFKYKLSQEGKFAELLKDHLQLAISNYWRSLKCCTNFEEQYNIRNNLANCLISTGRFIEALSLLNHNINSNSNRFQSNASWGHAMEYLKEASLLPDVPSFYFEVSERYLNALKVAPSEHIMYQLKNDIERCKAKLKQFDLDLTKENLELNRTQEQKEFSEFSEFRKYVLKNELSLNEHALHCHCKNSEKDNLSIGLYGGSTHINNPEKLKKLERYLSRVKSEFSFARLLFYKFEQFDSGSLQFYHHDDVETTSAQVDDDLLGYDIEHLRTSYRILYGLLDKIASLILLHYNIPENGKSVYFEDVFHQFQAELSGIENIHFFALFSMSLDLSQSLDGVKVGSLGFYKKIRNKLEHGLLILNENETSLENGQINISEFKDFVIELMRLSKSAIFSSYYLIRTETIMIKE